MGRVVRSNGPAKSVLLDLISGAEAYQLKVGWLAGSSYPADRGGIPVAYAAVIAEYGYAPGNIPSRPILGPTVTMNAEKWKAQARKLMHAVTDGGLTLDQAFNQLGLVAAGDIKKTITTYDYEPLAQSTIDARARRKHTTPDQVNKEPLRDSGLLINTVAHEVTRT